MKSKSFNHTRHINYLNVWVLALSSILLINCSVLDSNNSNSLSGIVIAGDNPVTAKVALIESDTILFETQSDSMGRYAFSNVPEGLYSLAARIDWAYGALYDSVPTNGEAQQNITLNPFKRIPVLFEGEAPVFRWYGDEQIINTQPNDTATVLVYLENTSMHYTMVYPDTTLELTIIDVADSLSIIQSDTTIIRRGVTDSIPELIIDTGTIHIREPISFSYQGMVINNNSTSSTVASLYKQGVYSDILYDTVIGSYGEFAFSDIPMLDTQKTVNETYTITIRDGWSVGSIIDSGITPASEFNDVTLTPFRFMPFELPDDTQLVTWFGDVITLGDSITQLPFLDESVSHFSIFVPDSTIHITLRDSAKTLIYYRDGQYVASTFDSLDTRTAFFIE